jgi:hypothetical protein
MKPLLIILALSNTAAIVEMFVLLIVAALIGYFTAYFYYKSVYTKIINRLEVEKEELTKRIADLKDETGRLNDNIKSLNSKITELELIAAEKDKEIALLKNPKKR